MSELTPRRFVSIRRTVLDSGIHVLDAIADDGSAWWYVITSDEDHKPEWRALTPLPPGSPPD